MNKSIIEVNFGNKSKDSIMGKGNIKICSKNSTNVTIANIFFILDFFFKFVDHETINKIIKIKMHIINISSGVCTVCGKNKMIAKMQMTKNMMFPMFLQEEISLFLVYFFCCSSFDHVPCHLPGCFR